MAVWQLDDSQGLLLAATIIRMLWSDSRVKISNILQISKDIRLPVNYFHYIDRLFSLTEIEDKKVSTESLLWLPCSKDGVGG